MNRHGLSTFSLPFDIPTFWQFAVDPVLSFKIRQLDVPILDAAKWAQWWHAYVALNFCLLEVVFHLAELADRSEEDEIPYDEPKLLILQAWRTDTDGELLGILFGEVRNGHLDLITDEVLVFLTQLLDDLPLDILSRCDERPGTATLARTSAPRPLWSTCTELDVDHCYYPPEGGYQVINVTDLSFWDPLIRRVDVGETSEEVGEEEEGAVEEEIEENDHLRYTEGEETPEEEESEAESDDPDYQESEDAKSEEASSEREETEEEEAGSGESSGLDELSKEEREVVAQRKQAAAEGKRSIEESGGPSPQLLQGDPTLNPILPQEQAEGNGGATTEGSGSRCRRRSESLAQSPPQPNLRLSRDGGARASSPIVIPSSARLPHSSAGS
ncbi:hypothetical protein CBR_g51331 [Chara braunii]|uniref:Uncharacterized protein n=1 Tax=Chara braunii TaxID=69332 RepID=A0A388M8F5_CHABU|nr:hypothetical protein CBR_g51331 [Chara braunii]|eukprot:GBG90826.1 hypothetical protein CBR_g51331 [Chara braunii]